MKKLLLATAVVFAASQASAAVYNVTIAGAGTLSGGATGGSDITQLAGTQGTYNTETGVLLMGWTANGGADTMKTAQTANVDLGLGFPIAVKITLFGGMEANFTDKSGYSWISRCEGAAAGCNGAGTGAKNFVTFTGGPADIANPFAAKGSTFTFANSLYDEANKITISQTFTVTNMSDIAPPTSEVPVPAAAWLFGSALAGLAGLRKRK